MSFTGNEDEQDIHGPVPDDLVELVGLLNTIDVETGADDSSAWLKTGATPADVRTARQLRGALRALAAQNCGGQLDTAALLEAARLTKRLGVSVQLVPGPSAIVVEGDGAHRQLGEVLASYARAVEQGRWSRVKLCASSTCRWAFWDGSKNGSRKWCAMRLCGSRAKMRGYRERLAG